MKKEILTDYLVDMHIGCFGNYDPEDPICHRFCALNLRCTIEQEQNVRLEMLEDLVSPNHMTAKIQ